MAYAEDPAYAEEVGNPGVPDAPHESADRACVGHPWNAPGALATWTGNVADALRDLIAGRLPMSDGGFWFVDGDWRHLRPIRQLCRPASYAAPSIRSVTSRSCARNSRS